MMRKFVAIICLSVAVFAAAAPAQAQLVAGTVNAKQTGTWTVQPGNTANTTAWLVTGTGGIFPASQSGTWNITNISGTVSLPTGAATESSLAKIPLAQGSTTSGQSGALIQGAVTTSAPSYTNAQTSPLSLMTTGALRIDNSSWLGSTAPTVGSKTSANSIPVVIASDQATLPTTQGALTSIATGQQAVTATATALPSAAGKRVCLKVLVAGTQTVYFGASAVTTSTGQELSPGDAACLPLDNASRVYVIAAATGSTVAYDVEN
jgi:hypothetical protein